MSVARISDLQTLRIRDRAKQIAIDIKNVAIRFGLVLPIGSFSFILTPRKWHSHRCILGPEQDLAGLVWFAQIVNCLTVCFKISCFVPVDLYKVHDALRTFLEITVSSDRHSDETQ